MKGWIVFGAIALLSLTLGVLNPYVAFNSGPLSKGHIKQQKDCLSCHTPFVGVPGKKCVACHNDQKIKFSDKTAFHKKLKAGQCLACHKGHNVGDHRPFSHQILPEDLAKNCVGCHPRPSGDLHKKLDTNCASCHTTKSFRPAEFEHSKLPKETLAKCLACHNKPVDKLHRGVADSCAECHSTKRFKPATFDHDRYFRFDSHHETGCKTCHQGNDYQTYTCFGCHEHTPRNILGEHNEEGIYNTKNCADCHPSGDEDEATKRRRKVGTGREMSGPSIRANSAFEREVSPGRESHRDRKKDHHKRRRGHDDDHDDDDDDD